MKQPAHGSTAVSYTHLDVYKRQSPDTAHQGFVGQRVEIVANRILRDVKIRGQLVDGDFTAFFQER